MNRYGHNLQSRMRCFNRFAEVLVCPVANILKGGLNKANH
jgi:hypothetical protein